jgi:hypothetical protein
MAIPEKFHRMLQKLIEQAQPQTKEELDALMESIMNVPLDERFDFEPSVEDEALDMVGKAWNSSKAKGKYGLTEEIFVKRSPLIERVFRLEG